VLLDLDMVGHGGPIVSDIGDRVAKSARYTQRSTRKEPKETHINQNSTSGSSRLVLAHTLVVAPQKRNIRRHVVLWTSRVMYRLLLEN
jgi:hypothetical protein